MPTFEQLHRLLEVDPTDAFTLYAIAQEHLKRGEAVEAVGYFDRCLASDPGYLYAYYHKARALEGAGRMDEALACARVGLAAARGAGEGHAESELASLVMELEP